MRLAIIQDLINAYEDHSRSDFDAHLARLEQMLRYTGPVRTAMDAAAPMIPSHSTSHRIVCGGPSIRVCDVTQADCLHGCQHWTCLRS